MRIGIISDTHIPQQVASLPDRVAVAFKGVDLILHAGDICVLSVLDELERIAPVYAAVGDDDCFMVYDARVKQTHRMTLEGKRLLMTHVQPRVSESEWLKGISPFDPYVGNTDVFVFGHMHMPRVETYNGILIVTPGSPTLSNYAPRLGTVAILTIEDGRASATIEQL